MIFFFFCCSSQAISLSILFIKCTFTLELEEGSYCTYHTPALNIYTKRKMKLKGEKAKKVKIAFSSMVEYIQQLLDLSITRRGLGFKFKAKVTQWSDRIETLIDFCVCVSIHFGYTNFKSS